jgi:hypothetical protein
MLSSLNSMCHYYSGWKFSIQVDSTDSQLDSQMIPLQKLNSGKHVSLAC